jgi:hypothetical protein
MERLGGSLHEYTDEQKEELAEVDRVYDAKIAQAKFEAKGRRAKSSGDSEQLDQIQDDLAVELRSIEQQREKKKEALRSQFQSPSED